MERARPTGERGQAAWARWLPWAVGLLFVLAMVPPGYLDGGAALLRRPAGDFLQHQTGILAYLNDAWRWPPFQTRLIAPPEGVSLVFLDALPGPSLLAKAAFWLTGVAPPLLGWWIVSVYLLQPVAMARLLRAMGVEHWLPLLCGALISLACSWFLWRFGHSALSAHWLLLLALAWAVEAGRDPAPARWLARLGLLALACLFVHAYLFAMTAALAVALTLGLALAGRLRALAAAGGLALWLAAAVGCMALLGYFAYSEPLHGYGRYSMNLLSPFVPQMSGLWPDFGRLLWLPDRPPLGDGLSDTAFMPLEGVGDMLDATGGQYEGLAWLGFGLWPLLLLALWLRRRALPGLAARHWPLLLACLGMTLFALSPRVWVAYGPWQWIDVFPEPLQAFRSNGRFVWPLAYLAAAGAVAGLAASSIRRQGASGWLAALLVLLTLTQLADARLWYQRLWDRLRAEPTLALAPEVWQPIIARHAAVVSQTLLFCHGADWERVRAAAFSAVSVGVPISDAHVSLGGRVDCLAAAFALVGYRPPPGTLLLLSGAFRDFQAGLLPPAVTATCRRADGLVACSDLWPALAAEGLAPPP